MFNNIMCSIFYDGAADNWNLCTIPFPSEVTLAFFFWRRNKGTQGPWIFADKIHDALGLTE